MGARRPSSLFPVIRNAFRWRGGISPIVVGMKKLILLPLILSILFAPHAGAESRIVGGEPAGEGTWPAQALVRSNGYFCGGTLIHKKWVLSAAHCFAGVGSRPSNTTVSLGSHDFSGGVRHKVSSIHWHSRYTPDFDNDIALLRLQEPSSQEPRAIASPEDAPLWQGGTEGYIAGWGTTCFKYCSASKKLLQAEVPVRPHDLCSSIYETVGIFYSANMVCAGGGPDTADSCQGDSGGPLEINGSSGRLLLGIVSWGIGCAEEDFPGVYTNVSRYNSWIGGFVIDKVEAPTSVRVGKGTVVSVQNRGSLALEASLRTSVRGSFRVQNGCKAVAPDDSCSLTVTDLSARKNSGELFIRSRGGVELARVSLQG